ncbi:MAG: 30S ribosomal protein S18 [Pseudomonadota bacterium]|nr:30S ribosomal protein S18 [Pseudomonadota bacterium]MEC8467032.1 30S ribosomal protein S18 [Pseudomonadota bacterium]
MSEEKKSYEKNDENKTSANLIGKPYFRRKKSCPFSGPKAPAIDFKDTRTLSRFVSPYGKMLPSHITGVSNKKQRELAIAIKRARHLALMPYTAR